MRVVVVIVAAAIALTAALFVLRPIEGPVSSSGQTPGVEPVENNDGSDSANSSPDIEATTDEPSLDAPPEQEAATESQTPPSEEYAAVVDALPAGQPLLDFVNSLKPSIATVVMKDRTELDVASSTAFFLTDSLAVTNHQAVAQGQSGRVQFANGQSAPIRDVAVGDTDLNLSIVTIERPEHLDAAAVVSLPLAARAPRVGDEVIIMTKADGRDQPSVTKGAIQAIESIDGVGEVLTLDVALLPGSTGSPVFNSRGEVIGVASFTLLNGEMKKFAIPAASILALRVAMDATEPVSVWDYHRTYASSVETPADAGPDQNIEATIVTQQDGSILIDDQYVVRGAGTEEDPYRISWDLLVSASRVYRPRDGKNELPQRVTFLDGKWITITGYVAFPLMVTEADEVLMMLNQWDGCCIGVPPTPYDALEVFLTRPLEAESGINIFNYGTVKGKLKVDPYVVNNWLVGLYVLESGTLELEM